MGKSKKWIWGLIVVTVIVIWWPSVWVNGLLTNEESVDSSVNEVLVDTSVTNLDTTSIINQQHKKDLYRKDSLIFILKDSIEVLNYTISDLKYVNNNKSENSSTALTDHIKNNTKFLKNENENEKLIILPNSEFTELKKFLTNRYSNRDTLGDNE